MLAVLGRLKGLGWGGERMWWLSRGGVCWRSGDMERRACTADWCDECEEMVEG